MSLQGVPAVGDSLRDAQAAAALGCAVHWVRTGKGAQYPAQGVPPEFPAGTVAHPDLSAFVDWLLVQSTPRVGAGA